MSILQHKKNRFDKCLLSWGSDADFLTENRARSRTSTFCCSTRALRAPRAHHRGPLRPHLLVCTCRVTPVRNNRDLLVLTLQGIVGNLSSGKSALVHRYLTGTYVQEESPEGKSMLPAPVLF